MKQPISVTVDAKWPIAYVQYLNDDADRDGSLVLARDPDGIVRDYLHREKNYPSESGVIIDVTPDDDIIGFEIFSADDLEAVTMAREYAMDNDLAFPDDLRAAAARSPAA